MPVEVFLGVLIGWQAISIAVMFSLVTKPVISALRAPLSLSVLYRFVVTYMDFIIWVALYSLAMFVFLIPGAIAESPIALILGILLYMGFSYWVGRRRSPHGNWNRFLWCGAPPLQSVLHITTRAANGGSE